MWTERRSKNSYQRGKLDHREPYERDSTRVIHCPAFRRLQRKTQILGTHEGDFHRTRLTHSLEVASIGRSIARNIIEHQAVIQKELLPNDDLMSVICLLHDIGHPPFGHGGEVALNYKMRNHGGFEGNSQTLRLLTKVETSYGIYGLDLTRRSLLGILKYPVMRSLVVAKQPPQSHHSSHKPLKVNDWLPPKAYFDCESEIVEWLLLPFSEADKSLFQSLAILPQDYTHGKSAFCSFDCSIMNIADDIAYGVHDLEDAIHLGLINRESLDIPSFHKHLNETFLPELSAQLINDLFSHSPYLCKQAIGELVNYFINATEVVVANNDFENSLLKHNLILKPQADALLAYLMQCIYVHVIDSPQARILEFGGQTVVLNLFNAINSNPGSLLDIKSRQLFLDAVDETSAFRVVCDYVANMTDEYAHRLHERLYGFNTRLLS